MSRQWRRPRNRDLSSIRKAKGSESFKNERKVNSVKLHRKQILRAKRRVLELLIQSSATSGAQFPKRRLGLGCKGLMKERASIN